MNRRAFTLIEVMLALILAGIVVTAAMGVLGMLTSRDARLDEQLDRAVEASVAQTIIRRAMGTLASAAAIDPTDEELAPEQGGTETQAGDPDAPIDDLESALDTAEPAEPVDEDSALSNTMEAMLSGDEDAMAAALRDEPPYFEIYYDTERDDGLQGAPTLSLVLQESPAPPSPTSAAGRGELTTLDLALAAGPVRGVFDLVLLQDGPALTWIPLEAPAGYDEMEVLIRGVTFLAWTALPPGRSDGGWQDVYAAYLKDDFPRAVRLEVLTEDGRFYDWLFETTVADPAQ